MKARHGLIAVFLALAVLVTATPVLAEPAAREPAVATDAPATDPAVPATEQPADTDKEVTAEDLARQAQKIQADWVALGWMGGTIGIIGLLLLLLRFKPIDDLLEEHELKHIKPYVAAGLGVLLGFLQTFITGKGWALSIVAGLIAGIATPGLHQLFTKGNTR